MNILAIDIGGTSVKIAVFDSDMNMLLSENTATDQFKLPIKLINFLANEINKYKKSHEINSVGIGVPGITDKNGKIKNAANIPIIQNVDLARELERMTDVQIIIDNDANVAALYESRFGSGTRFDNFIYVTLGTGIGGAIVLNKEIFRGDSSSAGEIGFVIIDYDGEKKVLEDFIGRRSFLEYSHKKLKKYLDIKDISDLAESGDELAVELMKYYGKILGLGLVSAMNLLDIPNVVIGGGVSACTNIMYQSLEQEIKNSALPNISESFQMRKSKLLGQTGLFGAACLTISQK
jgi:glucokinase